MTLVEWGLPHRPALHSIETRTGSSSFHAVPSNIINLVKKPGDGRISHRVVSELGHLHLHLGPPCVYSYTTSIVKQDLSWMRRFPQRLWTELSMYHFSEASNHVFSKSTKVGKPLVIECCILLSVVPRMNTVYFPNWCPAKNKVYYVVSWMRPDAQCSFTELKIYHSSSLHYWVLIYRS